MLSRYYAVLAAAVLCAAGCGGGASSVSTSVPARTASISVPAGSASTSVPARTARATNRLSLADHLAVAAFNKAVIRWNLATFKLVKAMRSDAELEDIDRTTDALVPRMRRSVSDINSTATQAVNPELRALLVRIGANYRRCLTGYIEVRDLYVAGGHKTRYEDAVRKVRQIAAGSAVLGYVLKVKFPELD